MRCLAFPDQQDSIRDLLGRLLVFRYGVELAEGNDAWILFVQTHENEGEARRSYWLNRMHINKEAECFDESFFVREFFCNHLYFVITFSLQRFRKGLRGSRFGRGQLIGWQAYPLKP